jgi:mono/diheme cytochrome c family protein
MRNTQIRAALLAALALWIAPGMENPAKAQTAPSAKAAPVDDISRGRYMVLTGHCNNCHTAGYTAKQGNMPESEWLLGNPVGYRSDAGTTYATNLRYSLQSLSEEQWVKYAKATKPRAPMPWWSLHDTTEQDLRAMYRFVKSLSPVGYPAPAFVPPEKDVPPPYEVRRIVR